MKGAWRGFLCSSQNCFKDTGRVILQSLYLSYVLSILIVSPLRLILNDAYTTLQSKFDWLCNTCQEYCTLTPRWLGDIRKNEKTTLDLSAACSETPQLIYLNNQSIQSSHLNKGKLSTLSFHRVRYSCQSLEKSNCSSQPPATLAPLQSIISVLPFFKLYQSILVFPNINCWPFRSS